jgi:hypothetical protein
MTENLVNLISFLLCIPLFFLVYKFFNWYVGKDIETAKILKIKTKSAIETGTVFENIEIKIYQKENEKVITATIGYIGKPLVKLTEYELKTLCESLKDFYKKKGEEAK